MGQAKRRSAAAKKSTPTAAERMPAGPKKRRRKGLPSPWLVGLAGLAALVALQVTLNVVAEASLPGERFRSQGNIHVALGANTPAYNSDPPTSGWHTAELAPWGAHLEVQHDQRLLHNMEDGGVVLWYPLGTREENAAHVAALEDVARGYGRVVIVPREGMPTTYALTAWQRLQRFEELDGEGMRAFLAAYHGVDNHR
ncbi:MAG: DUF3105 domain-containing protein [Trueperaceae bacterium]